MIAIVNSYIDTRTNSFHSAGWRAFFLSSVVWLFYGTTTTTTTDDDDDDTTTEYFELYSDIGYYDDVLQIGARSRYLVSEYL